MSETPGRARSRPDLVLVGGLVLIAAGAAALRFTSLGAHLPALVAPDEPVVMDRARIILSGHLPTEYDWPTGAMVLLAGVFKVVGHTGSYLLGRAVFATVGVGVVVLTGVLGVALADDGGGRTARRFTAWGAAGLVGVAYVSVRLSRQLHPDHLQLLFVLGSFLAALRYDRSRRLPWLAAAGALAGLAAATKYLGGLVAIPAAIAVLASASTEWRQRGRDLGVLAGATLAGVLAGAPGLAADPDRVIDGVRFQLGHQSGGHLGYDGDGNGWWFHLTTSLPGSWGWLATVAAVAGIAWVLAKGTRAQRLAVAYAGPVFLIACGAKVRFPHYVLPALPFLAAFAAIGVLRAAPRLRAPAWVGLAVLGASVLPALVDDVRLVRASTAPDTRLIATALVRQRVPEDVTVWTERYGLVDRPDHLVADLGSHPELLDCGCVLVSSSYQEDRFRREPTRYRDRLAVYDQLRATARVLATVTPDPRLDYDWDLLPQWGINRLSVTKAPNSVGPVVTVFDLRRLG